MKLDLGGVYLPLRNKANGCSR